MANKLDDRYVEYDLANSINVLPVENGGTGVNSYPYANRILITKATGNPNSPISIEDSGWGVGSLGALASWDPNKGPFEARIQSSEAHISNTSLHIPSGGSNETFLRGDNTWQTLASNFYGSLTENGWTEFPNGLIIQWHKHHWTGGVNSNTTTWIFPKTFPNQCVCVSFGEILDDQVHLSVESVNPTFVKMTSSDAVNGTEYDTYIQAIGY